MFVQICTTDVCLLSSLCSFRLFVSWLLWWIAVCGCDFAALLRVEDNEVACIGEANFAATTSDTIAQATLARSDVEQQRSRGLQCAIKAAATGATFTKSQSRPSFSACNMCIYHTYHWTCCPGTARTAPYYMHLRCVTAEQPRPAGAKPRKCKVEFKTLNGGDHDEPCPRCGCVTLTPEEETILMRDLIG